MTINRIIRWVVIRFPGTTLVTLLLLSVLAATQLPYLETDPSPMLLAPDHESRVGIRKLRQTYTGSNSGIIVMLAARDTVFKGDTLARIQKLTRAFENLNLITPKDREHLMSLGEGCPADLGEQIASLATAPINVDTWMHIDEAKEALAFLADDTPAAIKNLTSTLDLWLEKISPIKKVSSLSSTDNILVRNDRLEIGPIYDSIPLGPDALAKMEKEVTSNDMFQNILVSNNSKNTSINIELNLSEDAIEDRYLIYKQVKEIVENKIPGPETYYIAGLPAVTAALGKAMEDDSKKLFAIVILLVMTCLIITFRMLKGLLVPLAVVLLSLVVTLGVKAFLGIPLNIITISLPVFILSIGVADGIHMFSEYRDCLLKGLDKKKAVEETLDHLTMPVIMTSLTTAAAFYAISITKIVQLKYCGLFVCLGALVAMVFSLFFIPALLMVLPEKAHHKQTGPKKNFVSYIEKRYSKFLVTLTHRALENSVVIASLAGIVFLVFLVGASKVKVDNNTVNFFMEDSDIYISSHALNRQGAGSSRINFLISADSPETEPFKQPENLRYIRDFMAFLNDQPQVGKAMGMTELIRRIHFVLNDQDPLFNLVPISQKDSPSNHLISQLLLLYENGGGDALSDYVTADYTQLNLPVVLQTNSSLETKILTDRVRGFANQIFPDTFRLEISGSANIEAATTTEIVKGQITGLTVSILVVLVMIGITFQRIGYTLIAMIPLVMTITINFGVMGFLGIPLDIGTSIISSVVIGIGVDYSIHYLSRLKKNIDKGMAFTTALDNTVRHSGKAIISNAITVGLGFMALWFSVLTPLIIMGWLISLTMVVSALCALVLLPVFFYFTLPKAVQAKVSPSLNHLPLTPEQR